MEVAFSEVRQSQLLRDSSVAPTPKVEVPVLVPDLDNAHLIAWDEKRVKSALTALKAQLDGTGLMFRVGCPLSSIPGQASTCLASALRSLCGNW